MYLYVRLGIRWKKYSTQHVNKRKPFPKNRTTRPTIVASPHTTAHGLISSDYLRLWLAEGRWSPVWLSPHHRLPKNIIKMLKISSWQFCVICMSAAGNKSLSRTESNTCKFRLCMTRCGWCQSVARKWNILFSARQMYTPSSGN